MRHYVKALIISAIAFYIAYSLVPTISLGPDPKNIAVVLGGIFITSMAIHPIFSLILLPINLLSFGLLSLALNIALIFALIRFLPGFAIGAYDFPGANIEGFIVPALPMNQLGTIVAVALIITVVQKILHIIFE
ncbi:phage holin family protein [Candidatus Curtissbacteria bacterium]|nr:phage holin family protein [Candidatus Curtissbacteria bacterium]